MSSWDRVNDDSVILEVHGQELKVAESYEVKISLFEQPAAFSVRCGSDSTAAELLAQWKPGDSFKLFVKVGKNQALTESTVPIQVMTGIIDSVGTAESDQTQVEIVGRDDMARVVDAFVEADQSFHESTYVDLTRKVMDMFGLKDRTLFSSNLANRKAITGRKEIKELVPPRDAGGMQIEETTGGTRKVVYRTIKARLGERWYDFLQRQYKRVGLFLWCTGDGNFVLTDVNANQEPVIRIVRRPADDSGWMSPSETAAGNPRYNFNTVSRNSKATVWGRAQGGRAGGRKKIKGEFVDDEMVSLGFNKPITVHDDDVKTDREAEYVARRFISEQRRAGFLLEYPLSGHSAPSLLGVGRAVYNFDTVVEVQDQILGINARYYVTDVTFAANPHATTRIRLARRCDLVFAEQMQIKEDPAKSLPKHPLRVQVKR